MNVIYKNIDFFYFTIIIAMICVIQPVLGQDDSMTISYRGSGGYFIGDTIIFDGKNTFGTITLLKISGPGLPPHGVPVYDLNGAPGSGNAVPVNEDGTWKFVWFGENSRGLQKLVTARYTITAFNPTNLEKSASVSILLKKPDFYINPQQSQVNPGDYVQLNGIAELGVTEMKIDVTDVNGTILRSYTSAVSGSGSFNYGFRADLQPGHYVVTVSNPAMNNVLKTDITVVPSGETAPPATISSPISTPSETVPPPSPSPNLTQPLASSPLVIPLSPLTSIAGLIISGIIALVWLTGCRK